tara:strand:+ start:83 stop:775 length:693 start_codon:yes stop_codon:yes gene_type:complete
MIKSIETYYKGYLCRSRTEARWMVAFDKMGIQFEYEPEGFDLGKAGKYLPDFYLPQYNTYAEVKGRKFNLDEIEKAKELSIQSHQSVLFLEGQPARKGYWFIYSFNDIFKEENNYVHISKLPYPLKDFYTIHGYENFNKGGQVTEGSLPIEWFFEYKARNRGVWRSDKDYVLLLIDIFNPRKKFCFIKNDRISEEKEYIFSSPCGLERVDESDSIAVRASRSARFEHYRK